jgi:hypothetical protein
MTERTKQPDAQEVIGLPAVPESRRNSLAQDDREQSVQRCSPGTSLLSREIRRADCCSACLQGRREKSASLLVENSPCLPRPASLKAGPSYLLCSPLRNPPWLPTQAPEGKALPADSAYTLLQPAIASIPVPSIALAKGNTGPPSSEP